MIENPVYVKEIKGTSNPDMKTVVFEQAVPKPVTDINSLLNFANNGNPSFGSSTQRRVAFFNFSPEMISQLGFVVGQPVRADLYAKLVVHEFCEGDLIPVEIQSYYEGREVYEPRSWKVNEGTPQETIRRKEPKMTPKIGDAPQQALTKGGNAIYRETHIAMLDMVKGDITIQHDNRVTGSSNALKRSASLVGTPEIG